MQHSAKQHELGSDERLISDLEGLTFVVPEYQRGYRWDKSQVRALIDDLLEFQPDGDHYCLQPIVVYRLDEGRYELIDGQQRLTTIFIIMKYVEQLDETVAPPFVIEYLSREGSRDFLRSISNRISDSDHTALSYPDFYYMHQAWNTIDAWCKEQKGGIMKLANIVQKLIESTSIIWYEPEVFDSDDAKKRFDLFRRINIGKVPLTNAELIKALLISRVESDELKSLRNWDQETHAKEVAKTRANEIASEWDSIEHGLQNDSFWLFLENDNQGGKGFGKATRIDLIFDILAQRYSPVSQSEYRDPYESFFFNSESHQGKRRRRSCRDLAAGQGHRC